MPRKTENFTNIQDQSKMGSELHTRWNPFRKCMLVMLLLLLAAVVSLAVVLIVLKTENDNQDKKPTVNRGSSKFCITKECVLGAGQVIAAMNPNIDPCDDFYQFACGGWIEKHSIPADSARFGTFPKIRKELQVQLRGLLETPIHDEDIDAVKKTKRLYTSCVDKDEIERVGRKPILNLLKELGGWPVLDKTWNEANFNLVDLLIKLRLYNNDLLMTWGVTTDKKEPKKHIIFFDEEGLGMPSREHYLKGRNDPTLVEYENIALNAAIMLGADVKTARKDIKDMIDFEINIANITATRQERHKAFKEYNKMTIEHLQNVVIPDFPFRWIDLLQPYFRHANITINETTEVLLYQLSYLKELPSLLNSTNARVISNYLITRFVRHRIHNLGSKFRRLTDEYDKKIYGTQAQPARWKTCVNYVNDGQLLGHVTGRMFIEKYFDSHAKIEAKVLISNLRKAFKKTISEATWMDSETKKNAEDKLAAIQERIGFDDHLMNDTMLDTSNEKWDITDDYFGNVIRILRQYAVENMELLEKDVVKSRWPSIPGVVNAFYSPTINTITFPAGILQPPFYGKNYPSSLNYGGIGSIIGHEMTHGFDNNGRAYDKNGDKIQWWTNSSLEHFVNRTQCIVNQYSEFVENGDHIRGNATLGEDIADNGGMKIAFRAYMEHIAENGEELPLPGLNLTHKQLVFVSFSQAFCSKATSKYMHKLITRDVHPPENVRITATLRNSEDFASQFKCKRGSPMNPVKKCSVW